MRLFIYLALAACCSAAPPESLDGWAGYKFGMTRAQADSVSELDAWRKITIDGRDVECLVGRAHVATETGDFRVAFDAASNRVVSVTLFFSFKEDFSKHATPLIQALVQKYGLEFMTVDKSSGVISWRLPKGGQVQFFKLNLGQAGGTVRIDYSPYQGA